MKRIWFLVILMLSLTITVKAENLKYDIFATTTVDANTYEVISKPVQNFMTAYLRGNTLQIGKDKYMLYNKKTTKVEMENLTFYDGVDENNQRCMIAFSYNPTADPAYSISIQFEGSRNMYIFISNKPESL